MRVSELGEFGLIHRLTAGLASRADVLLAAGDDAALLDPGPDAVLVATIDVQVEGQHFLRGVASWAEIGHKALAVNLSDIAAMGAEPLWALVSLILPPSIDVDVLDRIYAGLQALAARYDVAIVGGNVAATEGPLILDIAVLGRVGRGRALVRSGGRPGDVLLVTGTLGAAAAGALLATRTMPRGKRLQRSVRERVRQAMVAPMPRLAEGRALAAASVVTAMLDVSDGVAGDLHHLCAASGVGAVLDASAIPVDAAAAAVATAYGRDPLRLALTGGEDYELLASVRPEGAQGALDAVAQVGGEAWIIGELTGDEGNILLRLPDGMLRPMPDGGWDHLRGRTDRANPAS